MTEASASFESTDELGAVMKTKHEMIDWMNKSNVEFDSVPQDGELHGWRFRWGHYEPYLENISLKSEGLIGTSIYPHEVNQ
ncbi:hypothetical protein NVP1206O_44 [Vibrio phage 1.206.O._10N.222.51.B10]|nr:hypothetical protein NVP1206O_44 [Vibrio phage 1.206.O._10N.222.51.B10]